LRSAVCASTWLTSAGGTLRGATVPDAFELLLAVSSVNRVVGVEIAGGVDTRDDADRFLTAASAALGEDNLSSRNFRLGSHVLLENLLAAPSLNK
jgi:deoxyribose-phosphate aldolase